MYQRTGIILDWSIIILIYLFVLICIPISPNLISHLGIDTANVILNVIINISIATVFISLFAYLILRKKKSAISSYIWLGLLSIITALFLINTKITADRLHFLGYGILSLFTYRALRHSIGTKMVYIYVGLFIMLFAILDEILQLFGLGGRSFQVRDIGVDWLSGLAGQGIIALVIRPNLEAVNIKIRSYRRHLDKIRAYQDKQLTAN